MNATPANSMYVGGLQAPMTLPAFRPPAAAAGGTGALMRRGMMPPPHPRLRMPLQQPASPSSSSDEEAQRPVGRPQKTASARRDKTAGLCSDHIAAAWDLSLASGNEHVPKIITNDTIIFFLSYNQHCANFKP